MIPAPQAQLVQPVTQVLKDLLEKRVLQALQGPQERPEPLVLPETPDRLEIPALRALQALLVHKANKVFKAQLGLPEIPDRQVQLVLPDRKVNKELQVQQVLLAILVLLVLLVTSVLLALRVLQDQLATLEQLELRDRQDLLELLEI